MLGTVANHNLRGFESEAVLAREFVGDGLSQTHIARHGAVEDEIVFDSLDGSSLDVGGCVEIGFSDAEIYHVDSLSLELCALLRHCERLRHRKALYSIRYLHSKGCVEILPANIDII